MLCTYLSAITLTAELINFLCILTKIILKKEQILLVTGLSMLKRLQQEWYLLCIDHAVEVESKVLSWTVST